MTHAVGRLPERLGLAPRTVFLGLVLSLLALTALLLWGTHEVYEGVTDGNGVEMLDHPVLRFVVDHRSPAATVAAVAVTELAGRIGTPALTLVALVVLTWRRRDWSPAVVLLTGMTGSLVLTIIGKAVAGRVRPPAKSALPPFETSPSFPSGHTLNATVLAALVVYLVLVTYRSAWVRAPVGGLGVVFPPAVAASRVYLGKHWLTDVLAGLLLGLAWACAVVAAHRVWLQLRGAGARPGGQPPHRSGGPRDGDRGRIGL